MLNHDETYRVNLLRRYIETFGDSQLMAECIKKDGTRRKFVFTPSAIAHHISGTERGERYAASRRASHPEHMAIFDTLAGGVRTLNLATITTLDTPRGEITFDWAQ